MFKRTRNYLSFAIFIIVSSFIQYGCHKQDIIDTGASAKLVFSTNIVKFDTVFTSVGSATHNFTARNPGKKSVVLSHITLQGGANSYFRINIDGRATTDFPNKEIAAGDSIYIFAEVTIDPTLANIPFIVTDTILFILNGHTQKVALQAFGRNAHFINNSYITCNADWVNDGIPYVIYEAAGVRTGCTLTIEKGVNVYCHSNTVFLVFGTLITKGTKDEPVVFRQDRLEHAYDNSPGQWWGLRFTDSSTNSVMTHTIVGEAVWGIEVDSFAISGNPYKLTLNKCIVKNCSQRGLFGFTGTFSATNTLVYSCGINVVGTRGGTYNFLNCTFDNSLDGSTNPQSSVQLDNYPFILPDGTIKAYFSLTANFENCIINGTLDDEVKASAYTTSAFSATFDNNMIKAKKVPIPGSNFINQNPKFKNPGKGDFHLDTLSFAINKGKVLSPPVTDDLDDVTRDTNPDIGCYEFK